ncbi:unnamed protein product [Calicophoron daubneyi]|uniref:Zinc transporter ZIP3 n=1 Tax=Calicophoron daubneyi TaxID=300641 RepID=A0AAV2T930_CALDB
MILIFKSLVCVIIFLLNAISSFLTFTYVLKKSSVFSYHWQRGMSFATCFSIGLFLAICFLGLYNSSAVKLRNFQSELKEQNRFKSYPVPEALLCVNFFGFWIFQCCLQAAAQRLFSVTRRISSTRRKTGKRLPFLASAEQGESADEQMDLIPPDLLREENFLDTNAIHFSDTHAPEDPSCQEISNFVDRSGEFTNCITLTLGMGLHTILEAIGFGLLDTLRQVFSMGLAMALHHVVCASTLGLHFAKASQNVRRRRCAIGLLLCYLFVLPLGTSVGVGIHYVYSVPKLTANTSIVVGLNSTVSASDEVSLVQGKETVGLLVMGILQNVAAAAFLYISFTEVLPSRSQSNPHCRDPPVSVEAWHNFCCCIFALLGFSVIGALRLVR